MTSLIVHIFISTTVETKN